jgi:DNA-binding GntR family transcriptional regulator
MELYEMRAVLEGTAARMAARAASDLEIDELVALNETLSQAGIGPEAVRLNRLFHANLLDSAKNRYLARSVASLQKALLILGPTMLSDHARAKAADTEHRRILDALKARDEAGAELAMRNHIEASQRLRIRSLRDRDRGHYDT